MRSVCVLILVLTSWHSHAANPMITFEMKIDNARVFEIDGARTTTDLTITGKLFPRTVQGTFLPAVIHISSKKNPDMTFSYEAMLQLAALFWEAAAYEIMQETFKIGLHYELGQVSQMTLTPIEKPYLSLESLPLRQTGIFGRVLIRELHLFTDSKGEVEGVNARFVQPGKEYEPQILELDIERSYTAYWTNGRMRELVTESGDVPVSPTRWRCAGWIMAAALGSATAYLLLGY